MTVCISKSATSKAGSATSMEAASMAKIKMETPAMLPAQLTA